MSAYEVATIIWDQLTTATKMATGARKPTSYDEGRGAIRITVGRRQRWLEIVLDPSDTYTVRLIRVRTRRNVPRRERIVLEELHDIYVDQLNEVVYDMTHREGAGL